MMDMIVESNVYQGGGDTGIKRSIIAKGGGFGSDGCRIRNHAEKMLVMVMVPRFFLCICGDLIKGDKLVKIFMLGCWDVGR